MTDRPRKKKSTVRRRDGQSDDKPAPMRRRLLLQFKLDGDPSAEQMIHIQDLISRTFGKSVRVAGRMPGALRIEVATENEAAFRQTVASQPDWDVTTEGSAELPSSSALEVTTDDKSHKPE